MRDCEHGCLQRHEDALAPMQGQSRQAAVSCDPGERAGGCTLDSSPDSPSGRRPGTVPRCRVPCVPNRWQQTLLEPFRGAMISGMGMNPHHQHRRSNWDYVYVAAAMVVALGVLAWAFLG